MRHPHQQMVMVMEYTQLEVSEEYTDLALEEPTQALPREYMEALQEPRVLDMGFMVLPLIQAAPILMAYMVQLLEQPIIGQAISI